MRIPASEQRHRRRDAHCINEDARRLVLEGLVEPEEIIPIGAAYASFNTKERTGYYEVVVQAVYDAATAGEVSLLERARERIENQHGDIADAIYDSQVKLNTPLRASTVHAFVTDGAAAMAEEIATSWRRSSSAPGCSGFTSCSWPSTRPESAGCSCSSTSWRTWPRTSRSRGQSAFARSAGSATSRRRPDPLDAPHHVHDARARRC